MNPGSLIQIDNYDGRPVYAKASINVYRVDGKTLFDFDLSSQQTDDARGQIGIVVSSLPPMDWAQDIWEREERYRTPAFGMIYAVFSLRAGWIPQARALEVEL